MTPATRADVARVLAEVDDFCARAARYLERRRAERRALPGFVEDDEAGWTERVEREEVEGRADLDCAVPPRARPLRVIVGECSGLVPWDQRRCGDCATA